MLTTFTRALTALGIVALVVVTSPQAFAKPAAEKCVNIYYDKTPDPKYWMGKTYATLLQNLLGHFPEFQQIVSPIELYQAGDLEKCYASLYIGSYFDNKVPQAFLADFEKTKRRVAWLGYNIWKLAPTSLESAFGFTYQGLTTLDQQKLTARGEPTFFKNVLYKGETFFKYGKFNKATPAQFIAPFEMTRLSPAASAEARGSVLAEAQHNGTGEKLPYIVRKANKFYVADVPFSFMHEADRYLIFADVLFDILGAKPRHNGRYAFLRVEDIHPLVPIPYLYSITKALSDNEIPINISLIPIFFDPLEEFTRDPNQEFVSMNQVPEFMQFLREMNEQNATMIWHGTTHQLGRTRNPHSGVSGDDFEFWDAKKGTVLAEDSVEFVLDRLDSGFYDLKKAGIFPTIWLTPHYQASPLDYTIFARVFPWNVGRAIYFNHHVAKTPSPLSEEALWYSEANQDASSQKLRAAHFGEFQITIEDDHWSGQMFPYEIYGDVFGQRLLPENLGNSQPTENEHVVQPRSVQEIVADAKRNLVIRDAWGSFFYHAQLLNTDADGGRGAYPGDPAELVYLVTELKKLGYKFIDITTFTKANQKTLRPEPIYLDQQTVKQ